MRVLVACEFSGRVTAAFRRRGHEAWSCDLEETQGNPAWHIRGNVLEVLHDNWDLMIAFPPCTFLTTASAPFWGHRVRQQDKALAFICQLLNAPIPLIALENPRGAISTRIRKPDQEIHPWHFGDPWMKRTDLWLNGLPRLVPTKIVQPAGQWVSSGSHNSGGHRNPALRAMTFEGIAEAMADQWGNLPLYIPGVVRYDRTTVQPRPEGTSQMAKSTSKHILFSRTTVGKAVTLRPIAVFNQPADAKAYATFLRLAHRSGDVEAAKSLDAGTMVTEDGKLAGETKWSVTEVPYSPAPDFGDDDDESGTPAAS